MLQPALGGVFDVKLFKFEIIKRSKIVFKFGDNHIQVENIDGSDEF